MDKKRGDGNSTGTITKGGQAAREWIRPLADLKTGENEQHEKNKTATLKPQIILEIVPVHLYLNKNK